MWNFFDLDSIGVREDQAILHLCCVHRDGVAICPRCREVSTMFHDEKERCVRDLDIWGKCTFLHFVSRRFDCERCGRPFTEKLVSVNRRRRHTHRAGGGNLPVVSTNDII